jgi:hypothetical protein
MIPIPRWTAVALALAATACGGGGGSASGGGNLDGCAWFNGANCWKTIATAATACTNGATTGTFNGATTTCGYADGTSIQFDPSHPATASYWHDDVWDFTVVASTACATYVETSSSKTLTVAGHGTFQESWATGSYVITCPDATTFSLDMNAALNSLSNCADAMPGWYTSGPSPGGSGPTTFGLMGMSGSDTVLWRCR